VRIVWVNSLRGGKLIWGDDWSEGPGRFRARGKIQGMTARLRVLGLERVLGAVAGAVGGNRRHNLLDCEGPLSQPPGWEREGAFQSRAQIGEKSVTSWAWRSPFLDEELHLLPSGFFTRDTEAVARDLLGCYLDSRVDGAAVGGVIVETEAYVGPHDPASHAAARIGKTERNRSMFGPPGRAYVYRSYGIHWCLNVVTERAGYPAAVLVRALDPIRGLEAMRARRNRSTHLCAGPGRLSQALGVSGELDGHPFDEDPLRLNVGWEVPEGLVGTSGRVGVRQASEWPLRFFVRGHPEVSVKVPAALEEREHGD